MRRELSLFDGLMLMVGITIGAGIFAMPGRVAGYFPSVTAIGTAWVLAAGFALTGSLLYAELGSRLPATGGEYVYLHRAFGPLPAFLHGWAALLVLRTNPVAALPLVFAEYASSIWPMPESARLALATVVILFLGAINYRGLRSGKRVQAAATILKVGGMILYLAAAVLVLRQYAPNLASTHAPTQPLGPLGNAASAMLLIIFAYVGWDRVGYMAGEMRHPERNIPLALGGGAVLVATLYLSMNLIYHAALPIGSIAGSAVAAGDVARLLWGPAGAALLAALVMVSTAGSTNANIMASSRLYYALASDGLFFAPLARIHPRWGSPYFAIILHCSWSLVLLYFSRTVVTLVSSFVFGLLIVYSAVTLAYFKLRRQGPAPFQLPGYPVVPAVYLAGLLALAIATCYFNPRAAFANLALMASGLPFYFLWKRLRRAK